jgi:hypothetical protein
VSGIERMFASALQGLAPGLPDPAAAARERLIFASGAAAAETRPRGRGASMDVDGEDFDQPLETRSEKARQAHPPASVGGVDEPRSRDATQRPSSEPDRREAGLSLEDERPRAREALDGRLDVTARSREPRQARGEP